MAETCGAKTRSGGRCRNRAGFGTDHVGHGRCKLHLGSTPNGRISAAREEAAEAAARIGLAIEMDPGEALLACVHMDAGEVAFLQRKVRAIGEDDQVKDGEVHPLVSVFRGARDQLARHSKLTLDAGIDERRVQLVESLGQQLGTVLRDIVDEVDLSPEQQKQLRDAMARHLGSFGDSERIGTGDRMSTLEHDIDMSALAHAFPQADEAAGDPETWVRERLGERLWSRSRAIWATRTTQPRSATCITSPAEKMQVGWPMRSVPAGELTHLLKMWRLECAMSQNTKTQEIVLRLCGTNAERGVPLADFETFIEGFLSAIRDLDRDRRGAEMKKSGHPEKRAAAVTALRLVGFRPGSGIATLEPELVKAEDDEETAEDGLFDSPAPSLEGVTNLLEHLEGDQPLPAPVAEDLDRAVAVLGDDASLAINVRDQGSTSNGRSVTVTREDIASKRPEPEAPSTGIISASGRLHSLDMEPESIGVRAADGTDWRCTYPDEMEGTLVALMGSLVWVSGVGERKSARRGVLEVHQVAAIDVPEQTPLFTQEPASIETLAKARGISGPQPLDVLGAAEWDEDDDAYLAAITS